MTSEEKSAKLTLEMLEEVSQELDARKIDSNTKSFSAKTLVIDEVNTLLQSSDEDTKQRIHTAVTHIVQEGRGYNMVFTGMSNVAGETRVSRILQHFYIED